MKIGFIFLLVLLTGCASLNPVKERERRFQPAQTFPPAISGLFEADCNEAVMAANANPNASNIIRLVDSCSAFTAVNCASWMDINILAEHGIIMRDNTAAAVGAATTIAAGAFGLSSGAVAGVGLAQMIAHLFGQVEKTGLGAPDSFQAQTTMLSTLGSCSEGLLVQAKNVGLSFSQAILGLDRCRRFCSNGAASAITTQALTGVEVEVQPNGRMLLHRRP